MSATSSTEQRTAIVTGAAGGLGLAVARILLERGDAVLVADVDEGRLRQAVDGLAGDVRSVVADLSDTGDCTRTVAEAKAAWGHVDVLVNCAAILHRVDFFSFDEDVFARIVNTNLRSVFWLCRGVVPGMVERRWGRIVNVTSVGIHTGGYSLSSAVYETTKAGIANLTKTLARSLAAEGVLVNSVAPGAMRTRMILDETPPEVLEAVGRDIPVGRLAEPAEVAQVVAFLASDLNTYVTGAAFDANGGLAMP
jgi:NAD(P)-dependent dehydrogenase (short-subunit alcohol dehydrogenase family)